MPTANSPCAAPRDWAAIARDYAAGALTVGEIGALYNVSTTTIYRHARSEGWKKRSETTSPSRGRTVRVNLAVRLLSALDQKMTEFENRMTAGAAMSAADSERDARTLNTLVRLFEKLKGIGSKSGTDIKSTATQSPAVPSAGKAIHDADSLRHSLAQRLEKLRGTIGD